MKLDLLMNHRVREEPKPASGPRGLSDESGQDLIEYALLASVISVGFVASIQAIFAGIIPFLDMVLAAFPSL